MRSWISGDIFTRRQPLVTLKSWEPWEYTVHMLFTLQNSDIGPEFPEWKLNWFAGVALLRTVGHVLHKVDSNKSEMHRQIIQSAWQRWEQDKNDNWIFFDFIERERNNILKEFSFGAELPDSEDERTLAYGNTDLDAAQLYRESVYWWRSELEKIEQALVK